MSYTQVVINAYGGPKVLETVERTALPEPGPGEVRVRVQAASASFSDMLVRRGQYPFLGKKPPFVPGYDVVGVVDALGPDVAEPQVGQRVADLTKTGAYTEYLIWPAERLVPVPEAVDAAEAVSMVLSYMTAYQMLHRLACAEPGDALLVHGGSGAVGSALLELGRLHGCELITTLSAASRTVAEQYGAAVIDYKTEDFVPRVRELTQGAGVAAAFDAVSGKNMQRSFRVLKRGGVLVSYGFMMQARSRREFVPYYLAWLALASLLPNGKRVASYSISDWRTKHPDWFAEDLTALFDLLAAGKLNPMIEARIPLSDVQQAHAMLDQGGIKGKLVLLMEPE